MSLELRLSIALAFAFALVYRATPVAIRVAERFEFYDHPVGYKGHARATPYLGGAAVMTGFVTAVVLLAGDAGRTLPVVAGVAILWALGTVDDRRPVSPGIRVAVEISLAASLWALDLGWRLGLGDVVDLAITILWVVAIVNAINLFDNMDGQATTIAGVIAAAVAVLGALVGDQWVAVAGAALSGACLGFLRYNLASPARIFLGDGGSMPIGFALAALVMIGASDRAGDGAAAGQALAMGLLFVGVPALDTALVIVSRRRRGISVLTGGRDHLTHRSRQRLRTASAVALALGGAQALLAALAVVSYRGGSVTLLAAVVLYLLAAGALIVLLDRESAPNPADCGEQAVSAAEPAPAAAPPRGVHAVPWQAALLIPLSAIIAASPWHFGFYASTIWAPAGLVLLVVLVAVRIARPVGLTAAGRTALAALFALAVWSLVSSGWASSAHLATVEGDRLLVYGVLLAVVLLLVRDARSAVILLGAAGLGVLVLVGAEYVRLAGAEPAGAFVAGRLNAPLGYINGLGTYLVLGLWLAVALAEQRRRPALAGLGVGCASLIATLLLLSQSRGVALAVSAAAAVLLIVVPGRLRRAAVLVLVGAGVAVVVGATDAVYRAGTNGVVSAAVAHRVVDRALVVAVALGALWALGVAALERARRTEPGTVVIARRVAAAALATGGLVAVIAALAAAGTIGDTVRAQYDAFVHLSPQQGGEVTSSRLLSGAGNRSDYWRIAARVWRDRPLVGIGAGSYPVPYFRERATTEDVRQPHSIELQTLSELGLIGGLLLAVFLAAVLLAGVRRAGRARSSLVERYLLVAGLGVFVSWLVHTSVDWIHLLPGVTAVALCAAGVLLRPAEGSATPAAATARGRWTRALVPALAVVGLLGVGALLSRLVLTERYADRAQAELAARPADALNDADRALRLDGNLVSAYYTKAAAFARSGNARGAERTLRAALHREPDNFVTWALLGDLSVRMGDRASALRFYSAAHRRNPRDPGLAALALGQRGRP